MIRKLFLSLHIYLITQKSFILAGVPRDPIVSTVGPAAIECIRTQDHRKEERKMASTHNYRACYTYEIDHDNGNCNIMDPIVDDIQPITMDDNDVSLYLIETPQLTTALYPANVLCYFVIGKKSNGFIYQYFHPTLFTQELEGSLDIIDDDGTLEVTGGVCQDFFGFREKEYDNNNELIDQNQLITCGDIPDPRIQFEIDVATTITLAFKSNSQNEFEGVNLYILEIRPSPDDSAKRRKRDVEAPPSIPGTIGDTGKQGAVGEPGLNGIPGRNGSEGVKGERGIPGVVGPEGDIGLPGETGIPGDIGPTGPKGMPCICPSSGNCVPGIPGRKGSKGSRGSRGDTGPRGLRGEPGIPGPIGVTGEKGTKGMRGPNGAKGLPGPRGDQGSPGLRGLPGPPGPPGLDGCPLPDDDELARRIREVGHIFATTAELYNSLDAENKMSADEFYNYIAKGPFNEEGTVPSLLEDDDSRVARSTESSTECNGVAVVSGPRGDQGITGLPGNDGIMGEAGIPGIDGTNGRAGDPGKAGIQGRRGARGNRGPRGPKGDKGIMGPPGHSGYCQCYQAQEDAEAGNSTSSQTSDGSGIPGRPGPQGPHGENGPPGSMGETGSPGSPGARGPKGFKGVNGVTGRAGSNGTQGDKGRLGRRGLPGPTGPPGPPGPPGYDSGPPVIGPKGEQGSPGFPGVDGDPGIPGLPGEDGVPGINGRRGDPGLYGTKGENGSRGETGSKGVIGLNGKQGPPGNNNTDCIIGITSDNLTAVECPRGCPNGLDGAVGDKGERGPKGFPGPKGDIGIKGLPGDRGVAGPPGSPGDKGITGEPGIKGPPGFRGFPGAVGPAGPPGPSGSNSTCPEYDGVDFDMFLSAKEQDIEMIQYLLSTSNSEVAINMTDREFPLLRELAKFVVGGYNFTNPKKAECSVLRHPSNGSISLSSDGTTARFYCNPGFFIKGDSFLACINGKWSSWPPVCSKINTVTN